MVDSPCSSTLQARTAILGCVDDSVSEYESLGRSSWPRSQHQAPPFGLSFPPLPGPAGPVPRLRRYYEGAATPCRHPAALRFLRSAVPRMHSLLSLSGGQVRREAIRLTRYLQPGIRRGANRVLPSSWGTTIVRSPCPIRRRQDYIRTRPYSAAAWPLLIQRQRLPQSGLRRSMAWLPDSLSTLRRASYPNSTQDSLPAAGQALLDGLSTPQGSVERFQSCRLHVPLSKLGLAQWMWPVGVERLSFGAEVVVTHLR